MKSWKIVTCIVAGAVLITAGIVGCILLNKTADQTTGNPESCATMDTGTIDGENSADVTDSSNTQISPAETSGDNGGFATPDVLIGQDDADQNDNNPSGSTTGNQSSDNTQQSATTNTPSNNDNSGSGQNNNGSYSGNNDNAGEGDSGESNQTDTGVNDDQPGSNNSQGVGLPEIPIN